ncbi:MAG: 5'/3'-nucleotidase SurE [bacterium]
MNLRVLLTNDDGIDAPGLLELERAFSGAGFEVLVVAPDEERSGASHSLSLRHMLRVYHCGNGRCALSGTPVDCVHIAVNHIFRDNPPHVVVSGINRGANLGCDINYSGTAAGAREAAMLGFPAFAVSLDTTREEPDFREAANYALRMAELVQKDELSSRTFLNVNVPDLPAEQIKGMRVTTQGIRRYDNIIHVQEDSSGNQTYRLGGAIMGGEDIPGSDIVAVEQGYVSVTPIRLDLTRKAEHERLRRILDSEELC